MGTEEATKIICDKWNGEGIISSRIDDYDPLIDEDAYVASICYKCYGHGVVDWIENIVGKSRPPQFKEEDFFESLKTNPTVFHEGYIKWREDK